MKKAVSFLCVCMCFFLFPIVCLATSSVELSEFGFSITMPENTYVITQNTPTSSAVWKELGVDSQSFLETLKENNIYVDAIDKNINYEIVVVVRKDQLYDSIYNLNLIDDDEIIESLFGSESTSVLSNQFGIAIEEYGTYDSGDNKFCWFSGHTADSQLFLKSYLSVVNGVCVQTTWRSVSKPLNKTSQESLLSIVDSIRFNTINTINQNPIISQSKAFDYSSILYKAFIGGLSALFLSLIVLIVRKVKRYHHNSEETNEPPRKGINSTQITEEGETAQTKGNWETDSSISGTEIEEDNLTEKENQTLSTHSQQNSAFDEKRAVYTNADEIRKFKELLDDGIITQEEFNAKKKQLLGL